jgi:hypothetical protein
MGRSLQDTLPAGHTEVRDGPTDGGSSFLERERAALGDDADFFVSEGDGNLASVEDAGDDDLLGGGGSSSFPAIGGSKEELSGFESSFPAIDTTNEVRGLRLSLTVLRTQRAFTEH